MNRYKAETALSLLLAIALFSAVVLIFSRWQSAQNRRLNLHFQRQQAMQILDNQIALKMGGLACENVVRQNQIEYKIQCAGNRLRIAFPLGHIELNND